MSDSMDDLLKEIERIAKAAQNPDQALELDIQKVINSARGDAKLPNEEVEALDYALHSPGSLQWKTTVAPTPHKLDWEPEPEQLEWFRKMIDLLKDGGTWDVPSTGHRYQVDKKNKTFKLIRDAEKDPDNWHEKNRVILSRIGWHMIDTTTTCRAFMARHGNWIINLFDFSLEEQGRSAGTRGQDAMAVNGGTVIRLGHCIGHWLVKHAISEFGIGKSTSITKD